LDILNSATGLVIVNFLYLSSFLRECLERKLRAVSESNKKRLLILLKNGVSTMHGGGAASLKADGLESARVIITCPADGHLHRQIEKFRVLVPHAEFAQQRLDHFVAGRGKGDGQSFVLDVWPQASRVHLDWRLKHKIEKCFIMNILIFHYLQ